MESVVLFYEKCRLCLDKPGISNIFEIENLSNDIFSCIGVKVLSTDNLPQKICLNCFEIVENAKDLRILAMKNDSNLKSLFVSDEEDDDPLILTHPDYLPTAGCSNHDLENIRIKSIDTIEPDVNENRCTIEDSKPEISVRKDLFENSGVVTSSTKSEKSLVEDTSKKRKKKNQDGDLECSTLSTKSEKSSIEGTSKKRKKKSQDGDLECSTSSTKSEKSLLEDTSKKKKRKSEPEDLECNECGKQFETRKKLYVHKRQHSKSIACPLDACGKMFATKGDLRRHVRIHTGDKPYSCDMCDRKFTQNGTLKIHKETVHG